MLVIGTFLLPPLRFAMWLQDTVGVLRMRPSYLPYVC